MVYGGTLCSEAEIAVMAGENVDVTGDTEANHTALVLHAETFLAVLTRYNWVTNFGSLTIIAKGILAEYCSRYAAVALIAFNTSGYTTRIEAEDMLNIHLYRMKIIEKLLSDQDYINFMTP